MKKIHSLLHFILLVTLLGAFTCCRRSSDQSWDDTRTAGRHMNRGVRSMCGKHGDTRRVSSKDEFYPGYSIGSDFIPLSDVDNCSPMGNFAALQPRETPGDPGSSIPGIEYFRDPSTNPELSRVFKNISFDYNNSLVKGDHNLRIADEVASYLKRNPNTYVFVEGHCDERGPEAFNLSLGSNRSNAVRYLLINNGVNPDQIFTISYGKERPLVMEHHDEAWAQNRRAEFKVYQR